MPCHSLLGEYSGSINPMFAEYYDVMCKQCSKDLDLFLEDKIREWKKGKV